MISCEYCQHDFIPSSNNGKYCSVECRNAASRIKMLDRYYRLKPKIVNGKRVCVTCLAVLSTYNKENVCQGCKAKSDQQFRSGIVEMFA